MSYKETKQAALEALKVPLLAKLELLKSVYINSSGLEIHIAEKQIEAINEEIDKIKSIRQTVIHSNNGTL